MVLWNFNQLHWNFIFVRLLLQWNDSLHRFFLYHFDVIFVHGFYVRHEVALVSECHFTSGALEWFHPSMLVHVTLQILPVREALFTDRALVSIDSFVSIFVPV